MTHKKRLLIPLPKLFTFKLQRRWGIVPQRFVLLLTKRNWRPYYSMLEWRDHRLTLHQQRGWFIGRVYVGVEGVPITVSKS